MRLITPVALLAALLPAAALAQAPAPADTTRTEPDQELDNFSGGYQGMHQFTPKLRGVRAAHNTVYWVSADSRQLSAYQQGKLLWRSNVAAPFLTEIPTVRIKSLALASNIIFVNFAPRGMAEVDRATGRVVSRYFDRDPNNLVPEPESKRP